MFDFDDLGIWLLGILMVALLGVVVYGVYIDSKCCAKHEVLRAHNDFWGGWDEDTRCVEFKAGCK